MVPMHYYKALAAKFDEVADLNRDYGRLRLVKSAEEVDWYRISARLSDLSIEALTRELRPGLDEGDVAAIIESAYLPWRASTITHDQKAGVQTGELVLITKTGAQSLHSAPRGAIHITV